MQVYESAMSKNMWQKCTHILYAYTSMLGLTSTSFDMYVVQALCLSA